MSRNSARRILTASATLFCLATLTGCKPDNIFLSIKNESSGPVHDVKLAYPDNELDSGTLGVSTILGAYRHFDGPGNLTLTYSTDDGRTYSSTGPPVTGNEKGEVDVSIDGSHASWNTKFETSRQ